MTTDRRARVQSGEYLHDAGWSCIDRAVLLEPVQPALAMIVLPALKSAQPMLEWPVQARERSGRLALEAQVELA